MEFLKLVIALTLQISLITLAQNITESSDNLTQLNSSTENSNVTIVPKLENSTIHEVDNDNNQTVLSTTIQMSSESTTSTTQDMLIPPADVEAQIEKLDVTSKKPSRIQVIAAQ